MATYTQETYDIIKSVNEQLMTAYFHTAKGLNEGTVTHEDIDELLEVIDAVTRLNNNLRLAQPTPLPLDEVIAK
jgi:hypothetical protein